MVGSRKQTDWKKIAYDTYEASFEISFRNHKKEDVVVKVVEPKPEDGRFSVHLTNTKRQRHSLLNSISLPQKIRRQSLPIECG